MTKGTKTYQWCIAFWFASCRRQGFGCMYLGRTVRRAAAKRQQKKLADTLRSTAARGTVDNWEHQAILILQRVSTANSLAVAQRRLLPKTKKRLLEMTSPVLTGSPPPSSQYACGQSE